MDTKPIYRFLEKKIKERLFKNKAILVFGPRQVGKTTLCQHILNSMDLPTTTFYADDTDIRETFARANGTLLKNLIGEHKIVLIDEAQRIPNIGMCLKIIVDQLPQIQVIATGSSSFDLANLSNEPLTGRKFEFFLYPPSYGEMVKHHGFLEEKRQIEYRMIYGYYPEIVTHTAQGKELLKLLAGSYLYKDLLMLEGIKKPLILEKLLKALALQLGSEVNYLELGQTVGADKNTVEKYIDLLEKAFVIFRIPAFNRNVRSELKKGKKVYFYDCGIRNAILNNFNTLASRMDVGALWENFFLIERMKFLAEKNQDAEFYFWRTTAQQEIDFIEESDGKLTAFECKWNPKAKTYFPSTFRDAYPDASLKVVNSGNFEEFILDS
jgi:predicted AAA+ superfamily ATPase